MKETNPKISLPVENFPIMGSFKNCNYGPFRENIRLFLQEFGEKIEDNSVPGMASWSTLLINEKNGIVFPIYTVEETVEQSLDPFCDYCKIGGWGHHFVSKRKYHLIIPEVDYWKKPLKDDFLKDRTHILYGLIHCNGYGHLICVNGDKGASNFLSETDAMNLWDRICSTLCTRKISVLDELDLRLLYVVGYGQSWYGKWGYNFSHGSFGVQKEKYEKAIQYVRSLRLDKIISDFKNKGKGRRITQIIRKYRGVGDIPLVTISDLLKFMLGFEAQARVQRKMENKVVTESRQHVLKRKGGSEGPGSLDALVASIANSSRWPARRVEFVLEHIVKFLKENKGNFDGNYGVSRYAMRDELRKCVGDTGLIDFVLKSITCFALGNQIVRRTVNPSTRRFHFSIQEVLEEVEPNCIWAEERVKHPSYIAVDGFEENRDKENTMPRQGFQNKARKCLGETRLIDFVVDSMDSSKIRNQRISRPKNPSTKRVEVTIQDFIKDEQIDSADWNVADDALYLYKSMLFGYKDSHPVSLATRTIMDSKHFVKEWPVKEHGMDPFVPLSCLFLPSFDELETELARPLSPAVLAVVPLSSSIGELQAVAQSALRDTYCIMDELLVSQIGGLKKIDEHNVVCHSIEPSSPVWVRGSGLNLGTILRYEDGNQRLTVDCRCGAKFDDGEKMATCIGCDVSQHARCSGISDKEKEPTDFLCSDCDASLDMH